MSEYQIGQDVIQIRFQLAEQQEKIKLLEEALNNIFQVMEHNIKEGNLVEPAALPEQAPQVKGRK
jgi:hypothetical protein